MGVASEEPAPGLFLKLADVLTDGRLTEAKTLGCLGETPGLGDGQERLKQNRIEHGYHEMRLQ